MSEEAAFCLLVNWVIGYFLVRPVGLPPETAKLLPGGGVEF
jgi:hypothetical protein